MKTDADKLTALWEVTAQFMPVYRDAGAGDREKLAAIAEAAFTASQGGLVDKANYAVALTVGRLAASHGEPEDAYRMSLYLSAGMSGVASESELLRFAEITAWLTRAADAGHIVAQKALDHTLAILQHEGHGEVIETARRIEKML